MEEKIFQYLNNEISQNEKIDFEKELNTNPKLMDDFDKISLLSSGFRTKFIQNIVWDDMIEDYLNNQMKPEEKEWFENRLKEDKKLRLNLESHSLLKAALITKNIIDGTKGENAEPNPWTEQDHEVREFLNNVYAGSFTEIDRTEDDCVVASLTEGSRTDESQIVACKNGNSIIWKHILSSVAVSACVILASCGGIQIHNSGISNEDMNNIVTRGSSNSVITALETYKEGDSSKAISLLNEIDFEDELYSDAMYVKGMILLKDKWFSEEAIKCLEASENPRAKKILDKIWCKFLY